MAKDTKTNAPEQSNDAPKAAAHERDWSAEAEARRQAKKEAKKSKEKS
jgi:hypothetical protein